MQKAVGCPFNFLTSASRVMKDSFGLETRLLLVLQCCHDCKRRKAARDQRGNSPWGSKSMMETQIPPPVPHSVHSIRHYWPWRQLGKRCRDAGMIQAAPKLTHSYSQNRCNRENYYDLKICLRHFRVKNIQLLQATFYCKWKQYKSFQNLMTHESTDFTSWIFLSDSTVSARKQDLVLMINCLVFI